MTIKTLKCDELEALAQNITAPVTKELIERQENLESAQRQLVEAVGILQQTVEKEMSRRDERELEINRQLTIAREHANTAQSLQSGYEELVKHVEQSAAKLEALISRNRMDIDSLTRWRDHLLAKFATLEKK